MHSRRDFITGRFRKERSPENIRSIASDFTDDMLFMEMMRSGKDPSNMSREQMLHEVLIRMRTT